MTASPSHSMMGISSSCPIQPKRTGSTLYPNGASVRHHALVSPFAKFSQTTLKTTAPVAIKTNNQLTKNPQTKNPKHLKRSLKNKRFFAQKEYIFFYFVSRISLFHLRAEIRRVWEKIIIFFEYVNLFALGSDRVYSICNEFRSRFRMCVCYPRIALYRNHFRQIQP